MGKGQCSSVGGQGMCIVVRLAKSAFAFATQGGDLECRQVGKVQKGRAVPHKRSNLLVHAVMQYARIETGIALIRLIYTVPPAVHT